MCESRKVLFSESFKRHVVGEVESGRITQCQAGRKYGILGHSTILKWCRKYGTTGIRSGAKVMDAKEFEQLRLANENNALKAELEEARFKNMCLETLVDVAEKELNITIRKKYGAKLSGK